MTIRKVLVDQEYPDCEICGKVIEYGEEYFGWEYRGRVLTSHGNSRGSSGDGITKEIVMCKRCGDMFLDKIESRIEETKSEVKRKWI